MRSIVVFIFSFLIFAYFGYHFIDTHTKDIAQTLETDYKEKEQKLADLTRMEELWTYKVHALKPDSLDPDVAEESIRYVLNKGRKDEEVILV